MENNFSDFPYERPVRIPSSGNVIATVKDVILLKNRFTGIIVPYEMSYMKWFIPVKGEKGTIQMPKFDRSSESSVIQANYINLKHNCIRVAELINDQLRSFLLKYDGLVAIAAKEDLNKMDFLNLRNELSKIIKKDSRFHILAIFSDKEKRDLFTRTFTHFIEDRNIYTHGHLTVRLDDKAIMIEFRDKLTMKNAYCEVNGSIIQSFFQAYQTFRDTLNNMYNIVTKG